MRLNLNLSQWVAIIALIAKTSATPLPSSNDGDTISPDFPNLGTEPESFPQEVSFSITARDDNGAFERELVEVELADRAGSSSSGGSRGGSSSGGSKSGGGSSSSGGGSKSGGTTSSGGGSKSGGTTGGTSGGSSSSSSSSSSGGYNGNKYNAASTLKVPVLGISLLAIAIAGWIA